MYKTIANVYVNAIVTRYVKSNSDKCLCQSNCDKCTCLSECDKCTFKPTVTNGMHIKATVTSVHVKTINASVRVIAILTNVHVKAIVVREHLKATRACIDKEGKIKLSRRTSRRRSIRPSYTALTKYFLYCTCLVLLLILRNKIIMFKPKLPTNIVELIYNLW